MQNLLRQAEAGTLTAAEFQTNPQLSRQAKREGALWARLGATVFAQP